MLHMNSKTASSVMLGTSTSVILNIYIFSLTGYTDMLVSCKIALLSVETQPYTQLCLLPRRPFGNNRLQLWDANHLIKDSLPWA